MTRSRTLPGWYSPLGQFRIIQFPDLSLMVLVLLRAFVTYLRIQDRHIVHLSTSFIEDLRKEPFYKEARELCDRLANHYRLQIPDVEIRYLQVYFSPAKQPRSQ